MPLTAIGHAPLVLLMPSWYDSQVEPAAVGVRHAAVDAEDGVLGRNPIEQGSVDCTIGFEVGPSVPGEPREIVHWVWRRPVKRPRPLVVICDISGSMARYAQILLHFLHAVVNDRDRVHVFLFGTRLSNITRQLKNKDPEVAFQLLEDVHEARWRLDARLHRKAKAMRLSCAVVRVLAEDHDAHPF